MTSLTCLRCSTERRPIDAEPGSNLCATCGNQVLRTLREIEACYAALSAEPVTGDTERRAPGFASSPPARVDVLVETDRRSKADDQGHVGALAAITSWTRLVAYERDLHQPEQVSIRGETGFLRANHAWLLAQDWIDEYATELVEVRRRLVALVGLAPDPPAGHCIQIGCDGLVYPLPDASGVRCRTCRTRYTGTALARLRVAQQAA